MKEMVINIGRLRNLRMPPRIARHAVMGAVLAVLAFDTVSQVGPEEVGIVLRHGRHVRTVKPGLRLEIPLIERMLKVPIRRQLLLEFGFRRAADNPMKLTPMLEESAMITGDLNVADVEWIVQYRIDDPYKFLFKVRDVTGTLRDLSEAAVSEVVGDHTVTEVITVGRIGIETRIRERLRALVASYDMGVSIQEVALQDASPPDPVKPAWDEVTEAQQQRERRASEARGEYNRVIPRAQGEAQQRILEADGRALDRVTSAEGDARRFVQLYEAYRQAPAVTRERLYLESMTRVLGQIGNKLVLESDAKSLIPLIVPENVLRSLESSPPKKEGGEK
ncbi:MAG: FtsH protease activity modulator HflK [Acidobacteriota bacterium]